MRYFKYFVLASVVFLAIGLYEADYLHLPEIRSTGNVVASVAVVMLSFLTLSLAWRGGLARSGFPVPVYSAIASVGLSIFGKYIPGKVWLIAGRAAYVSESCRLPLLETTMVSVAVQIGVLWGGVAIGTLGLFLLDSAREFAWLGLAVLVVLTAVIGWRQVRMFVERIVHRLLGRELGIDRLGGAGIHGAIPWGLVTWIVRASAFALLARGLLAHDVAWTVGLSLPLAIVVGALTVIAPGGIGVREGVLAGCLVLHGVSVADATTVAIAARVWYLGAEVVAFVGAYVLHVCLKGVKPPLVPQPPPDS